MMSIKQLTDTCRRSYFKTFPRATLMWDTAECHRGSFTFRTHQTATDSLTFCHLLRWQNHTVRLLTFAAQNCQNRSLSTAIRWIHFGDYATDYTSRPIYLECVCFSAGYLVSAVLVAAGSNCQFWLLHALLVIVIVTIITFLISETVEPIVIVIACLVVAYVSLLVLPCLPGSNNM